MPLLKKHFVKSKTYLNGISPLIKRRIKEPYAIGYPNQVIQNDTAIQARKSEIHEKLFPSEFMNLLNENKITPKVWKLYGTNYINKYPQRLTGIKLFEFQSGYKNPSDVKNIWNLLSKNERDHFTNGPNIDKLFKEQIRIWQGYEINEHIRRNPTSVEEQENPFLLLTLYPWEIIKDKLRSKRKIQEINIDYYDLIIANVIDKRGKTPSGKTLLRYQKPKENFNRLTSPEKQEWMNRSEREYDNKQLYHEQKIKFQNFQSSMQEGLTGYHLFHQEQYQLYSKKNIEETIKAASIKKWNNISTDERGEYYKLPESKSGLIGFDKFCQAEIENYMENKYTELSHNKINLNIGKAWKALSDEKKSQYTNENEGFSNTRAYRELILDFKVMRIMRFIYDVVGIVGLKPGEFDWKSDMKSKTQGFTYLDKYYTDKIIQRQKGLAYLQKGTDIDDIIKP